jgi:hypothetical protein
MCVDLFPRCPNCTRLCCASPEDPDSDYDNCDENINSKKRKKKKKKKSQKQLAGLPPTPMKRAKSQSSTSVSQKKKAASSALRAMGFHDAEPRERAPCLLSLDEDFVETCHVVRKSVPKKVVRFHLLSLVVCSVRLSLALSSGN